MVSLAVPMIASTPVDVPSGVVNTASVVKMVDILSKFLVSTHRPTSVASFDRSLWSNKSLIRSTFVVTEGLPRRDRAVVGHSNNVVLPRGVGDTIEADTTSTRRVRFPVMALARRLLATACAVTRTTDFAVRWSGARFFLPDVFVARFANLGGIDPALMSAQFEGARSFADERWVRYWEKIAADHAATADRSLATLSAAIGLTAVSVEGLLRDDDQAVVGSLARLIEPAASFLADRGPQPQVDQLKRFIQGHVSSDDAATEHLKQATIAVDSLVKMATYQTIAAWPGWSPGRMRAYRTAQRISEALVRAIAPAVGLTTESIAVRVDGEDVRGYAVFPSGELACAAVLVTNGLDGTAQELLFPLLKYRDRGLALVVMEMPGTYLYKQPMSGNSELIYGAMIDHLSRHPRIDGDRIGMFGLSFGGYWSTRMAATSPRLRCIVTCATPTHRSLGPHGAIGVPEVMVVAMRRTLGAANLRDLGPKLGALSLRKMYNRITVPLLIISGDADTVVDPRDSSDLANALPQAELRLYVGDARWVITENGWTSRSSGFATSLLLRFH